LDSVQITFQLLFFMFCLVVLGEPWRVFLRRFSSLLHGLDFLQILVLDIYLGGFLLYVIAVIPLHLFIPPVLYAINILSVVLAAWAHRKRLEEISKNVSSYTKRILPHARQSLDIILVALMFLFSLLVQTSPFSHLLFGSVRDTSIHSLFVQVIIENKQVPTTLQPYLEEGIIYPQGFTPMAAYLVYILNYLPPQAVSYSTSLFNSLTILGAYFLGKMLSGKSHLGLSLAFMFAFVTAWPKYITWGSNALVASFPFYFVCLGLLPFFAREKVSIKAVLVAGILFGYLSVLHLQTYETLVAAMFILWLYSVLKKEKGVWNRLGNFAVILCVNLLILSPFVCRALAFYQYPLHNIGVYEDIEIPNAQPGLSVVSTGITWLSENLASNSELRICTFILFFVSALTIVCLRKRDSFKQSSRLVIIAIATLLGELSLFLLRAIIPCDFLFYPHPMLLYFPFYFFMAAFTVIFYHSLSSILSRKIHLETSCTDFNKRRILVATISLMLLLGIYSPFLYSSLVLDAGDLYGSYTIFSVTTEQDRQLILWIKDNLSRNATILVNTFQSGTLIPSIADRKAVFPSFASSTSRAYQKLVALLEENIFNATTLNLMSRFNITDIYVGSGVSPYENWMHRWDPMLFLGNSQFKLLKNFGNAYLFHCNYVNSNVIFIDDFEHENWEENGWQTQYYGHGLGNATVARGFGRNDSSSLEITAQSVPTISDWEMKYAYWVYRDIFVLNNSDVTLSFYLNATEGFGGNDTFAVLISDAQRGQSAVLATPNGVFDSQPSVIKLEPQGAFSCNLSRVWQQLFDSSLPSSFVIQFVNYDFDGVKNVAHIDNIKIESIPIG